MQRDNYVPPDAPKGFGSNEELVSHINRLNAGSTSAAAPISPRALTGLMRQVTAELADLFESADPFAPAPFSVAWAGESESLMWFDMAREFTEGAGAASGRSPTPSVARRRSTSRTSSTRSSTRSCGPCRILTGTLRPLTVLSSASASSATPAASGTSGGGEGTWKLFYATGADSDSIVTIPQPITWKFLTKRPTGRRPVRGFRAFVSTARQPSGSRHGDGLHHGLSGRVGRIAAAPS